MNDSHRESMIREGTASNVTGMKEWMLRLLKSTELICIGLCIQKRLRIEPLQF
jgi:hypothetical protein